MLFCTGGWRGGANEHTPTGAAGEGRVRGCGCWIWGLVGVAAVAQVVRWALGGVKLCGGPEVGVAQRAGRDETRQEMEWGQLLFIAMVLGR